MKLTPENAEPMIRTLIESEVSTQPVEVIHSNHVDETVLVELDGNPSIHKGTTDAIEKKGWRFSGLTRDSDGDINVYFRPIDHP